MAKSTVKCVHCNTQVDKENCTLTANKRYVCNECFAEYTVEQSAKQIESDAYKDLIAYICELYSIKAPSMLMVTQIKRFKEEYNYTYQGMKAALEYFFVLQGNSVENSSGVGIIPYIYDEVKEFYMEKKALRTQAEHYNPNDESHIKNVTVVRSEDSPYKDMVMIPLDDINDEGEEEIND